MDEPLNEPMFTTRIYKTAKGWGIGIWLERWCWCFSYQNIFGAHTFYLPFATVIIYTPDKDE